MVKKLLFPLRYIFLALLVTSFLGACTPKKTSPVNDSLAEQSNTTVAAAAHDGDDDDDDGAWENDDDSVSPTERLAQNYSRTHKATGSTGELLQKARTALGTPYVRGGTSRNGFDCSGFVQWSYSSVGIQLPRTAREQSQVGTPIRRMDDMQAGDIVAFRHPKRGYHTGIYVGDGKFIHSPRKRNVVRINSLDDPYFSKTFMGARRLNVNNEGDIEAAEQMLVAYAKQPPSPKASASRSKSKKKQDKSSRSSVASNKKSTERLVALNTSKTTKSSAKAEKARSAKDDARESKSTKATTNSAKNTKADTPSKSKSSDKKSSATSSKSKADSTDNTSAKKSEKASTKSQNTKENSAKSTKKASASDTKKSSTSTSKKNTGDTKKSAR